MGTTACGDSKESVVEQADETHDQKAVEADVNSFKQLLGRFVVAAEKTRWL